MVILCENCDPPYTIICDFCWYHCFNGQWEIRRDQWVQVHTDDSFCWLTMLPADPIDSCGNFHCRFKMEKKEEN